MCRVLGVSPSGYYDWLNRAPSARAVADAALTERIKAHHSASRGTYGAPRIHADLVEDKIHVGRKRVARLMRAAGTVGVSRRKRQGTTKRDKAAQSVPDLVDRNFTADAPNQLWVADITYIPTWAGFLYLAVVVDVWSRRVVGWSMATHQDGAGAVGAGVGVVAAASRRGDPPLGPGLPVHVDRVRAAVPGGRRAAFDRLGGRLLRQRHGRVVLRDA
jgi:putative transposase